MTTGDERAAFLDRIRADIAAHGQHVTLVQGGAAPRFAYTAGLTESGRPEIVLAGAASLSADEVHRTVNAAAERLEDGVVSVVDVEGVGSFDTAVADASWIESLLLGAVRLYGAATVRAVQLVPQGALRTIDVPDLSRPWSAEREPVWRWLDEPWPFDVAPAAVAVTNLDALRGQPITEAARWEDDEWELFAGAGPDVPPDEVRVVPLATLLGFDPSLEPVTSLDVGRATHREPPGPWRPWGA